MLHAIKNGERLRYITLTDDSAGAMTVPDLRVCWNRMRTKLVRQGKLREYALVVELQQRGALHVHVACTGDYIQWQTLRGMARDAGWGCEAHIAEVKSATDVAQYSVKAASYSTKAVQSAQALRAKGAKRVRPIRSSANWLPGGAGLREIEMELGIRSKGESTDQWAKLRKLPDGKVRLVAVFG
jgi:hypothetical protein